jgi:hypothetical protein
MRDRIYYLLAIAVLLIAIAALVLVFGQDQPVVSLPQTTQGTNMQSLLNTVSQRVNNDAQYQVRIRINGVSNGQAITLSQGGTHIAEVGQDYVCLSNDDSSRVCYPFSQLLAVAVPGD